MFASLTAVWNAMMEDGRSYGPDRNSLRPRFTSIGKYYSKHSSDFYDFSRLRRRLLFRYAWTGSSLETFPSLF